jgi:hypothetical protein
MGSLGSHPTLLEFVGSPDDGAHVWAITGAPLAWQQIEHPQEFEVMPDVLLQGTAYRLRELAGLMLPHSLTSVVGGGPEVLNALTHPMTPSPIKIAGAVVLALRRTFDQLQVHTTLLAEGWVCAVSPTGTRVVLV